MQSLLGPGPLASTSAMSMARMQVSTAPCVVLHISIITFKRQVSTAPRVVFQIFIIACRRPRLSFCALACSACVSIHGSNLTLTYLQPCMYLHTHVLLRISTSDGIYRCICNGFVHTIGKQTRFTSYICMADMLLDFVAKTSAKKSAAFILQLPLFGLPDCLQLLGGQQQQPPQPLPVPVASQAAEQTAVRCFLNRANPCLENTDVCSRRYIRLESEEGSLSGQSRMPNNHTDDNVMKRKRANTECGEDIYSDTVVLECLEIENAWKLRNYGGNETFPTMIKKRSHYNAEFGRWPHQSEPN